MRATKIGLLLLILAFGGVVETAFFVENRLDVGPSGCRALGWRPYGPSFTFEARERHEVAAGSAVEVENAFGAVRVTKGQPGEVQVLLRKVVYRRNEAEARAFADRIHLTFESPEKGLRLSTNRRELEREGGRPAEGFETHLEVTVPPETPVTVRNEHGEVELSDVARAEVWASFESVRVERVAGSATVEVRHGRVEVEGVGGDLTLSSRHGRVEVRQVAGHVRVSSEHGAVSLHDAGSAWVEASHGDVDARAVRGDLEATARHGGVLAEDVGGKATLEATYEDIEARRITGDARLTTQHGAVVLEESRAAAHVTASFGDVKLVRVAGPVEVVVEHGAVFAEGVEKGAKVKAAGGEVVLERFAGAVEVEVERAGARLTPAGPLAEPIVVRTQHGDIDLEVPSGSRMSFEAETRQGQIEVEVPGFAVEQTVDEHGADRVTGRLGDGGPIVRLTTDHGGVRVVTPKAVAQQP